MTVDPARVQEMFKAVYMHLTTSYNFFKYNGKIKIKNVTSFSYVLSKQFGDEQDIMNFFLSNQVHFFLKNQRVNTWIGEFCNQENISIWKEYEKELQSKNNLIKEDAKILLGLKENIKDFTKVYSLWLKKKVSWISICNFMHYMKLDGYWSAKEDPLSISVIDFLKKVQRFVIIPFEKFRNAILSAKESV